MVMKDAKTSWGDVAEWYDGLVEGSADSYQRQVLLPNIVRLVAPEKGMTIIDVGCGQGYFSRAFAAAGAKVIGCDISPELIGLARNHSDKNSNKGLSIEYHIAPSNDLSFLGNDSADVVTVILALQNIEDMAGTLSECSRALKKGGRLLIVLNHPAFRVLKNSSWEWDDAASKQFRRIDSYMSDSQNKIDMTPGEKSAAKKRFTFSFHRPLQSYFKAFNKAGLAVSRLEEWISHKKSQTGPRAIEEDRMRKEIPLFLAIEAVNL